MEETLKLGELTKNLKITNKDVIAKLAAYGVELKSAASAINEDIAGLILDMYTQSNEVSESELNELRSDALKAFEAEKERIEAEEARKRRMRKKPPRKKLKSKPPERNRRKKKKRPRSQNAKSTRR